jgi:threonine aldolase
VTGTGTGGPPATPAAPTRRRRAIAAALAPLPPPRRSFASDTTAPALPEAVAAVAAANVGHADSYGADPWTRDVVTRFRAAVGDASAQVRLCFSGTGANMLAAGLGGRRRLVVAEQSHIALDEEGGPLQLSGARQTTMPAPGGRIEVATLRNVLSSGPGLVCVSEATEDGTVYGTERLREICAAAQLAGSSVMLDGARLPHALAATGATLADVWSTGVDHLVVGGTKAGLMAAEAVVSRSGDAAWWRRSGQLPAKTRFVAAQWAAIFPDRWIAAAGAANARATELAGLLRLAGIAAVHPVEVNLVFLDLDEDCAAALAAWAPVSLWDRPGRVRLATSWDTGAEDVARLAAGIRTACAA